MEKLIEIWKPISGYDHNYYISNIGRFKVENHTGRCYRFNGIIKIGNLSYNGYRYIQLRKNGKQHNKFIHRLVAEYFLDNFSNRLHVNHKDFNKQNNCINNLEMVTEKENSHHYHLSIKKYIGISFHKIVKKWISNIVINNKQIHIGYFDTQELAYKARIEYENGTFIKEIKVKESKQKGVCFDKKRKKWISYHYYNNKNKFIGYFNTELEALKSREEYLLTKNNI